jgi:transcriptional regulator with XRE-family HTH domain
MEDQRVGIAVRTVRIKQGKRQSDVARAAEVSSATVSRIERGHLDTLALRTVRRVCAVLEIRVELAIRSRGGDLDRMIAARHAQLAESVIRTLHDDSPDWQLFPEVSFAFWGECGVVDILAWHPGRRALLIIELKTEIVDVGEMLGTLDKKRRLGPEIAAQRGWDAESVSVWVIVSGWSDQ